MADNEHEVNGDSDEPTIKNEEQSQKKAAKHDAGAADLERVTDYAEEKEIFSSDEFQGAINLIGLRRTKEVEEKMAKEREWAKIPVNKDDVDLIVNELECKRTKAEQALRENEGDIVKALIQLTD